MKKILWILIVSVPMIVTAQTSNISGIWKLKEKTSLEGPDYYNGIPRVIRVQKNDKEIKFESVFPGISKDTIEKEVLKISKSENNETFTLSGRKKTVAFNWNKDEQEWVKLSVLSSKFDSSKPEINIIESWRLSDSLSELVFTKKYDGTDDPKGNQDYKIQGIYIKTTEEALDFETGTGNGLQFEIGLTWPQILAKAKREGKKVFVDCYATWCGPCKKMEKEVYPLNRVGAVMNEQYISVKVQMDTGKNDDEYIKITYPIARDIESTYHIKALPAYLFFDENGSVLHKEIGALGADEFIKLVAETNNPQKQIYSLVRDAKLGKLSQDEMVTLLEKLGSKKYSEHDLAKQVVRSIMKFYLDSLNDVKYFSKNTIEFLGKYKSAIASSDKMFKACYSQPEKIDSIVGEKGFAMRLTEFVISSEEIHPFLKAAFSSGVSPHWRKLERRIYKKFGQQYSTKLLVNAKVSWYKYKKDWKLYCKNIVLQLEMNSNLDEVSWLYLNGSAWDIFKYSNVKYQLLKALQWSEAAIKNQINSNIEKAPWASLLDTKANLLYKLGRTQEAIKYAEEAVSKNIHLRASLDKMKEGVPTWPQSNAN